MTTIYGQELLDKLFNQYNYGSLLIRGTDGQIPCDPTTVNNYLEQTFDLSSGDINTSVTNPWESFQQNLGPAFSTSLVSLGAKYPLLWYDAQYSNLFTKLSPPIDVCNNPVYPVAVAQDDEPGGAPWNGRGRNEFSFILKQGQFLGNSLWDGNSNGDINGNISLPPLFNLLGNRGTNILSYAAELPFAIDISGTEVNTKPVGNSTWERPDSNNTNKSFNPTFSARNDGAPVPFNDDNPTPNQSSSTSKILKNLTAIKGKVWDYYFKDINLNNIDFNDPGSWDASLNDVLTALGNNFGSGFEIEGYTFPPNYNQNESPWINDIIQPSDYDNVESNSYYNLGDMQSMNIATDISSIDLFCQKYTRGHCMDAFNMMIDGAISGGSKWINYPSKNSSCTIPLTCITNMMLPKVDLQDAATKAETSKQLVQYIAAKKGDVALKHSDFNILGQVTIFRDPNFNVLVKNYRWNPYLNWPIP
jgi:hypothetical protein